MASLYSDEQKAEALARMIAGEPIKRLSRQLHIPEATLRSWRNVAKAQPVIAPQKQEDIGELLYDLLTELAKGARAIARQLQEPGYLERQSAEHLAISLGVSVDKLAGLAGAIRRGQQQLPEPRGALEGEVVAG